MINYRQDNTRVHGIRDWIAILVITFGLLLTGIHLHSISSTAVDPIGKSDFKTSMPHPASGLIPAPSIYILSDDDWETGPFNSWVNGSGTWEDPYVFRNFFMDLASSESWGFYIHLSQKVFQIINCTIIGSMNGIYLDNAGNGTLLNNTCIGSLFGIRLNAASNNTITGNNCTNFSSTGIEVITSNNNTLTSNTCQGNSSTLAMYFQGAHNNSVIRNYCNGTNGIRFDTSNQNNITGNTLTENNNAIYLTSANNNTISGNQCTGNSGSGCLLQFAENNTVASNNCSGNAAYGIILNAECYHNLLVDNNCTDNSYGILAYPTTEFNTLLGNNCSANIFDGIYVFQTSNNSLIGNNCTGNAQSGINLNSAGNISVSGNNCSMNGQYGIYANSGSNNTLTGNNCTGNVDIGIHLFESSNFTLESNLCQDNNDGIWLTSSNNCTLVGNNCTHNSMYGIYITSSNATMISGNTCSRDSRGILLTVSSFFGEVRYNWIRRFSTGSISNDNPTNNIHDNFITADTLLASFSTNSSSIYWGQQVEFTDMTTGAIGTLAYQWNFGDGTGNSTESHPVHQFNTRGTWMVNFTVTDTEGEIAAFQLEITVNAWPLVVSYASNVNEVVAGNSVMFSGTTIGGVAPYTYQWSFGDNTANATTESVTHQFSSPGTYTVTLTVVDADGTMQVYQHVVNVSEVPTNPPPDNTWVIVLVVAGIVAIVGIMLLLRAKRVKGNKNN